MCVCVCVCVCEVAHFRVIGKLKMLRALFVDTHTHTRTHTHTSQKLDIVGWEKTHAALQTPLPPVVLFLSASENYNDCSLAE